MAHSVSSIKTAEQTLRALGNERRIRIVLFVQSKNSADVGAIARHLCLSFKATSRHIRVLASAGILARKQISTSAYYSLAEPRHPFVKDLLDLL